MKISMTQSILQIVVSVWVMLFSCTSHAQSIPILTGGLHQAHDYSFGPVSVPISMTVAHFDFDPSKAKQGRLQPGETMTVVVERSFNGGITYEPSSGANFDSINQPANFDVILPQPSNQGRVIRGRVTIIGNWNGTAIFEFE